MAVKTTERETARPQAPIARLAGWGRQGIDSFMAAQKILLDLVGQQTSLMIGMARERMIEPAVPAGHAMMKRTDRAVQGLADAGKVLLELAAGETELVAEGIKEALPLPAPALALSNVLRDRALTAINLEMRLLEAAKEQTHEALRSYGEGKGLMAVGASVAELARRGTEEFVESEKKFVEIVTNEISGAGEGHRDGHKTAPNRIRALTGLVHKGGKKYIEAQSKLLDVAFEQIESASKATGKEKETPRHRDRTSWRDLSEKSVRNFVTAQKSLMELVNKPAKVEHPTGRKRKSARVHSTPPKVAAVHHTAA